MSNNDQKNDKQLSWSNPQGGQPSAAPKAAVPAAPQAAKPATPAPAVKTAIAAATNRSAAKITGWVAVGIVAGVLIAWGITSIARHGAPATTAGSLQEATSSAEAGQSGQQAPALLTVSSPQAAGLKVAVSGVTVSEPTWVVVYESRNGTPGNVLGASLFFPGTPWGNVELLRGTVAGQTYFVTERKDNGDHQFSLKSDPFVLGDDGQPSWVTFTAN